MTQISPTDRARVTRAFNYIRSKKGTVYINGNLAPSPMSLENAVIQVETNKGLVRALAMINVIEKWGNYAMGGRKVSISIDTDAATLNGTVQQSLDQELEARIADGRIPLTEEESVDEADLTGVFDSTDAELNEPPANGGGDTGNQAATQALLELASYIAKDLYMVVKQILSEQNTMVNTIGTAQMRAGDRLCVLLKDVDDQAQVYVDKAMISARSIGEPGLWDYSQPLQKGTHLVMVVLHNNGRYDFSVAARICRASDYAPGGSKRPIIDLVRKGTDNMSLTKRVYYLKLEVV